jgi:hypothetical protein
MPSAKTENMRAFIQKMYEGLAVIDEQRAVIIKGIEEAESLINALENARARQ